MSKVCKMYVKTPTREWRRLCGRNSIRRSKFGQVDCRLLVDCSFEEEFRNDLGSLLRNSLPALYPHESLPGDYCPVWIVHATQRRSEAYRSGSAHLLVRIPSWLTGTLSVGFEVTKRL
jgi:hypothetical protein